MRVKCLAQEHNTMSPARAQTRTARSGVKHTNHEATLPPTIIVDWVWLISEKYSINKLYHIFWYWFRPEAELFSLQDT